MARLGDHLDSHTVLASSDRHSPHAKEDTININTRALHRTVFARNAHPLNSFQLRVRDEALVCFAIPSFMLTQIDISRIYESLPRCIHSVAMARLCCPNELRCESIHRPHINTSTSMTASPTNDTVVRDGPGIFRGRTRTSSCATPNVSHNTRNLADIESQNSSVDVWPCLRAASSTLTPCSSVPACDRNWMQSINRVTIPPSAHVSTKMTNNTDQTKNLRPSHRSRNAWGAPIVGGNGPNNQPIPRCTRARCVADHSRKRWE
jgi:hypothetical protein